MIVFHDNVGETQFFTYQNVVIFLINYWWDKPNYLITFPTQVLYSSQNSRVCVCYGNIQGYSQGKPKKTNIDISLVEQERFL